MGYSQKDLESMLSNIDKGKKKESYVDKAILSAPKVAVGHQSKTKQKGTKAKGEIEFVIKSLFSNYKKEYKFSPRKFKSDFFIPEINTLIEYEGIAVNLKEGEFSRHTHIEGYTNDCDKYNLKNL